MAIEDSELAGSRNVFQIGRNKFYDWKNEIPIKIPELKRSGIRIIVDFCRTPTRFPNQAFISCIPQLKEREKTKGTT
jgi:hypothetical protein